MRPRTRSPVILAAAAAVVAFTFTAPPLRADPPTRAGDPQTVQDMLKAYREAKTYAADIDIRIEHDEGRWTVVDTADMRIAFDRAAGKLMIDKPEFLIVADGKKLRLEADGISDAHLEVDEPAVKDFDYKWLLLTVPVLETPPLPEVALLLASDPMGTMADDAKVQPRGAGDAATPAVEFTGRNGAKWSLALDPKTHLARSVAISSDAEGEQIKGAAANAHAPSPMITLTYTIKVKNYNEELDPKLFDMDVSNSTPVPTLMDLAKPRTRRAAPGPERNPLEGKPAPKGTFSDSEGKALEIPRAGETVTVLTFDATWLEDGVGWLSRFQQVATSLKDKPGVGVYWVGFDDKPEDAKAFAAKHQLTVPVLVSDEKTRQAYGRPIPPVVVILDRGNVDKVYLVSKESADNVRDEVVREVQRLLSPATTQPK